MKRTDRNKGQRRGKYVGGYVEKHVKEALVAEAKQQDRSTAWLIKKILAEGVKHRMQTKPAA